MPSFALQRDAIHENQDPDLAAGLQPRTFAGRTPCGDRPNRRATRAGPASNRIASCICGHGRPAAILVHQAAIGRGAVAGGDPWHGAGSGSGGRRCADVGGYRLGACPAGRPWRRRVGNDCPRWQRRGRGTAPQQPSGAGRDQAKRRTGVDRWRTRAGSARMGCQSPSRIRGQPGYNCHPPVRQSASPPATPSGHSTSNASGSSR